MCKKRMARLRERTKSCGTSRATEDDSTPLRPLCDQDRTADATICALACPYSLALYIATMLASGTTPAGMEWSVHTCPKTIRTEVAGVLPSADLDKLLIVPTCQQATMELVQFGEEVDKQKDELLERFMAWAERVCQSLIAKGHWCDYIDPCSGLPMIHKDTQTVYPEVEGLSCLLGYKTSNAGCCKVVLHPKWGSAVYPATLFSTAPLDELTAAIHAAGAETSKA